MLAAQHILGLLALLASLALLLERMQLARLVAGLHSVSRPLSLLGIDRGRAALRLMLVLEGLERRERLRWRDLLVSQEAYSTEPVRIQLERWRVADWLLLSVFLVGMVMIVVHQ